LLLRYCFFNKQVVDCVGGRGDVVKIWGGMKPPHSPWMGTPARKQWRCLFGLQIMLPYVTTSLNTQRHKQSR